MKGKKIVSTSGSIYDRWIKNCFKETTFQVVSSPSAGVLAVRNGQADALMYDDAFLVGVAANASDLKMTNHKFLNVPWGVGIRKGETAMKRWVDAAIRGMKARDQFWGILRRTIPRRFYPALQEERSKPEGEPEVSAGRTARVELPDLGERRNDGRVAASRGGHSCFMRA